MLARVTITVTLALGVAGCSDTSGPQAAIDGGMLDASCGDACVDVLQPPCAECDTAELSCIKPPFDAGATEVAGFPITEVTATSCGGIKRFGTERLTVHCDTKELCSEIKCEKYTFSGQSMSTASGLKCQI